MLLAKQRSDHEVEVENTESNAISSMVKIGKIAELFQERERREKERLSHVRFLTSMQENAPSIKLAIYACNEEGYT